MWLQQQDCMVTTVSQDGVIYLHTTQPAQWSEYSCINIVHDI